MKKTFTLLLLFILFIPVFKAQQVFNKIYDTDSILNCATAVAQTLDGGYIVGGTNLRLSDNAHYSLVIKTDSLGNREWECKPPRKSDGI